jgi:signal transduction histidine kinase
VDRFAAALEALKIQPFDIVLLDLSLPDSHGAATVVSLLSACPDQAVVVLTGHDDEMVGLQTLHAGAMDYLVKGQADTVALRRSIRYSIERKRIEAERDALKERLREAQKLESIGILAGGVAHDFNNLLGTITGYADLLRKRFPDIEAIPRYSTKIIKAAMRGASLTGQLLTFSRKTRYELKPVDLDNFVSEIAGILKYAVDMRIRVGFTRGAQGARVMADEHHLSMALINLGANARDAMPEGGTLTIETAIVDTLPSSVKADVAGGGRAYAAVYLRDTGVGMDANALAHLFEPFFSTKGEGKGLGLANVYGCIQEHKGHIAVESAAGKGTAISIYLPLFDDTIAAGENAKAGEQPDNHQRVSILVVDDEDSTRECIKEILKSAGYEVTACADGEEAIQFYSTHADTVKLILLDLSMPRMSGVECFHRLRKANPGVAVIFLSGYDTPGPETRAEIDKADGFIVKSTSIADIGNAVAAVLKKKRGPGGLSQSS